MRAEIRTNTIVCAIDNFVEFKSDSKHFFVAFKQGILYPTWILGLLKIIHFAPIVTTMFRHLGDTWMLLEELGLDRISHEE